MLCPFRKKVEKTYIYSEEDTNTIVEEETIERFQSCNKEKCPFYFLKDGKEKCFRNGEY